MIKKNFFKIYDKLNLLINNFKILKLNKKSNKWWVANNLENLFENFILNI